MSCNAQPHNNGAGARNSPFSITQYKLYKEGCYGGHRRGSDFHTNLQFYYELDEILHTFLQNKRKVTSNEISKNQTDDMKRPVNAGDIRLI